MDDEPLACARSAAATIEGWLTSAEGELLFRFAADCPSGLPIVEIGSWKGKSTVWLASGSAFSAGTHVFAVDPHEQSLENPAANTLHEFTSNLARAGLTSTVTPVVAASHDAAQTFQHRPGVVFVDGSHLEEAVRVDLNDWFPKLVEGGVLALHDVLNQRWSGPRRAFGRMLWRSREITAAQFVDSIAWVRKVRRNTLAVRLRNRWVALLLMAYDLRSSRLPAPIVAVSRFIYRLTPLKRPGRFSP